MEQYISWLQLFALWLPWIALAVVALGLLACLAYAVLQLLDMRRLLGLQTVFIELTPPVTTTKTPHATKQLFSVLHGLETTRPWQDKLLSRKVVLSLEVVSSREQGIRYIVRVAERDLPIFKQSIISYLPDVRFQLVDEYLPQGMGYRSTRVVEFKQTGHFAFPLQVEEDSLEQHDPIAYLTGTMTKLAPGELIVFQAVLTPTQVNEVAGISSKALGNEDLIHTLGHRRIPFVSTVSQGIGALLFGVLEMIPQMFDASTAPVQTHQNNLRRKQEAAAHIKPARVLSAFEQQLVESIHHKISQPLFRTNIRALVIVRGKQETVQRVNGIRSSLASFSVPKYQSLKARYNFPSWLVGRYRLFMFKHRLPTLFRGNACLLSASEISDIYHFPFADSAQTENIVKSLSKTLPAPVAFKGTTDFDIVLGRNHHHGTVTPIGLTSAERERHVYIIGGTGNGKTTMMQGAIIQDIRNGKGLAIVDPHGDLSETILRHIPESRINDVVYLNPDDLDYPVGLNMLEMRPNLDPNELLREKDLVTESVISVFRKIFSDADDGGHRIEYVLRNTIQTALTIPDATLFTIYDLLNDPSYLSRVVRGLKDKDLRNFWENEMGKAGNFQRVKMVAGITAKIGRFLFSASAKRILEQPKSTIDFDDILGGKILICNFSKGLLGEDTSELFGITILAKLQMAALRRARVKQADRRAFYLYVDEFQNFATTSFVEMLSEARKYKLFLLMAEQSTSQQEEQRMVNIILANVGTVVCFRSGNPADENLVLPLFRPYIVPGEISNLPAYNFYMRLAAVRPQEPLSGETIVLSDDGSQETAERAAAASRANYAKKYTAPPEAEGSKSKKDSGQNTKPAARDDAAQKADDADESADDNPPAVLVPGAE